MTLGVGLYVHGSEDAVKTYMDAFGLTLGYHVRNSDGSFFHSELFRGDDEIVSVVESEAQIGRERVQLGFTFDTREALERAYEILRVGGETTTPLGPLPWSPLAVGVTDRFGINWYLTLMQHRPEDGFTPET